MRIGYVVQRYGTSIRGGAEAHCRAFAERLAARGHDIDVFTSCATDYRSWANELPAGDSEVAGVRVHRYAVVNERTDAFEELSAKLFATPDEAELSLQEEWMRLQGPEVPDLIEALGRTGGFDLIVFFTYLYYPTYFGLRAVGDRAVLHPTAHDEPPLHLTMFKDMFTRPRAVVFSTEEERDLVHSKFHLSGVRHVTIGVGIDVPAQTESAAPSGISGPYIVCVGRVDESKGIEHLCHWFDAFRNRVRDDVVLVLAGDTVWDPPEIEGLVTLGPVDDAEKWALLRGAAGLVQPSFYESFALTLLEAWRVGTPALVNGHSEVMVGHCRRSGGGLWYRSYAEFEVALERLFSGEYRPLGELGRAYVEARYDWDRVIEEYARFLRLVATL